MKILYIISSYNIYSGTPKKTLTLLNGFGKKASVYSYHKGTVQFKDEFISSGANIYEGDHGSNYFKHIRKLIEIIDNDKIDVVHTQFSKGETFAFLIKLFRPKVKVVCTFEGSSKPSFLKSKLVSFFYRKFDVFVYISKYVKICKQEQFPILKKKESVIIYNGTEKRVINNEFKTVLKSKSILCVSSLIKLKNIQILISAIAIIHKKEDINLYIAGEGNYRSKLEKLIILNELEDNIHFLGNQKNIGSLLEQCDVFVHPSYAEGFGLSVSEAMLAEKPIIVSNAGALPELIENEKTGLIVNPFNAKEWADAIIRMLNNPDFAKKLALNAKLTVEERFTVRMFFDNYEKLYRSLIN